MPEFEDPKQQQDREIEETVRGLQWLGFEVIGAVIMVVVFGYCTGYLVGTIVLAAIGVLIYIGGLLRNKK